MERVVPAADANAVILDQLEDLIEHLGALREQNQTEVNCMCDACERYVRLKVIALQIFS